VTVTPQHDRIAVDVETAAGMLGISRGALSARHGR